jgi:hemerythrin-like domain-containing protein
MSGAQGEAAGGDIRPGDPLDFILEEHRKHRRMCRTLDRLATSAAFEPNVVAALADFIRFDLTLHVIDEEEDLFPLLRARCPPEDAINKVLEQMTAEHAEDKLLAVEVRDVLNRSLVERRPPSAIEGAAEVLLAFAQHEKRHMTLENAVIIPFARRRLTAEDLAQLGERMFARRGRLVS